MSSSRSVRKLRRISATPKCVVLVAHVRRTGDLAILTTDLAHKRLQEPLLCEEGLHQVVPGHFAGWADVRAR
jgi:hypothetical protein